MAEREAKRIRQACQNCRRKKSRCSGERPVCAFCARLNQQCVYDGGRNASFDPSTDASSVSVPTNDTNLLARVALLESKLSMLDSGSTNVFSGNSSAQREVQIDTSDSVPTQQQLQRHRSHPSDLSEVLLRKFSTIPDLAVLESAADVYFRNCHNQPYAYFHEQDFRTALREGRLPSNLLLAFMATAARFSKDAFFEGRQAEAIDIFARTAWHEIFEQSFAEEDSFNIQTVQATNMLAVIDFVAGRHKLGWVKVGLSVRFAQGLRLNSEPDAALSPLKQEEHRRTFWSIYLLDRLVSCSPHRSPTISDDDCTVHLPCTEIDFRNRQIGEQPTLGSLDELAENDPTQKLGWFALTIFMASALGRIVRCRLQPSQSNNFLPWDSRDESASIWSVLLTFETYANPLDEPFHVMLDRDFAPDGEVDQQVAGHFVFAQMLYHLNQCLLHHPFLVEQRMRSYGSYVPPSFMKEVLNRAKEHAELLTSLLHEVQQRGYCDHASFYGYGAIVAGLIQRLFEIAQDGPNSSIAHQYYRKSINFLDRQPANWSHFPRMAAALRSFTPSIATARALIKPLSPREEEDVADSDLLWSLLDYGWLSDLARPTTPARENPYLNLDIDDWTVMDEIGDQNNGALSDDMFSTSNGLGLHGSHEDHDQHQPPALFMGDPWSELLDSVNMNDDSAESKAWEAPWKPIST